MAGNLKWHGRKVGEAFKVKAMRNVARASFFLEREVKKNISKPYPPPSKPGAEPHKRIGLLRSQITTELDKARPVGRVGPSTAAPYGIYLELGTSKMEPRPFLRPALDKNRKRIVRIIGGSR